MATETVSRPAAELSPLVTHDATELVLGLFSRATDKLTENDLINLLNCEEDAKQNLRHLAQVCASVGCMVVNEGQERSKGGQGGSGGFQSAQDVPQLLFALGGMVEHSLALLEISNQAEIALEMRRASTAKAPRRG